MCENNNYNNACRSNGMIIISIKWYYSSAGNLQVLINLCDYIYKQSIYMPRDVPSHTFHESSKIGILVQTRLS